MKILCFLKRKPGMSREEFIAYYEQRHAKLAASLLPFYKDYRRNYLEPDGDYRPEHMENSALSTPPFDVVTELTFAGRSEYDKMLAALSDPTIGAAIRADEEQLFDRSAMAVYVVDERVSR